MTLGIAYRLDVLSTTPTVEWKLSHPISLCIPNAYIISPYDGYIYIYDGIRIHTREFISNSAGNGWEYASTMTLGTTYCLDVLSTTPTVEWKLSIPIS